MYELNTIDVSGDTHQVLGVKQYTILPRIGEFIEVTIHKEKIVFVVVMLLHSLTNSTCNIYISNATDIYIGDMTGKEIFRANNANLAAVAGVIKASKGGGE